MRVLGRQYGAAYTHAGHVSLKKRACTKRKKKQVASQALPEHPITSKTSYLE
jgi:hypothetical protein